MPRRPAASEAQTIASLLALSSRGEVLVSRGSSSFKPGPAHPRTRAPIGSRMLVICLFGRWPAAISHVSPTPALKGHLGLPRPWRYPAGHVPMVSLHVVTCKVGGRGAQGRERPSDGAVY